MMAEIVKVDFRKGTENQTLLGDPENIQKLVQWVLPIIEKNEGWGTGDLTKESFLQSPRRYQEAIDATVYNNVHILVEDNKPIALIEFDKKMFPDRSEELHRTLKGFLQEWDQRVFREFNTLMRTRVNVSDLPNMQAFLQSKPIYTFVGVVLSPELQNKKTGISEMLYQLISDGIVLGYTSNPVIVRQRHKLFNNTLFFPSFDEFPRTIEEWAICLYVYADRIADEEKNYKGLELGALYSEAFVENRGHGYIQLANEMKNAGKITELDEKRIQYVLSRTSCASAIVSWN